jgi:hypothetical protein
MGFQVVLLIYSLLIAKAVWARNIDIAAAAAAPKELQSYRDFVNLLPDYLFDDKMKKSLEDIALFVNRILKRVTKSPIHPLPVNVALLRYYMLQNKTLYAPNVQDMKLIVLSKQFIAEALHYFNYANEAYNPVPSIIHSSRYLIGQPCRQTNEY